MADDSLHQPHDKLFKAGFSDPVSAAAFLSGQLPPVLSAALDWEQLRLEEGDFVDSHYRQSESDLLFSIPLSGHPSYLYLLFEHQRQLDRWLALRLLRYMVRIWERFLQQNPAEERLPVVLPVVLAQNAERWELASSFAPLFHVPAGAEEFMPDFNFRLIQLADLPFDEIGGSPAGIMVLRVLKAEIEDGLLGNPVWDEDLLQQIPRLLFDMIIRYIAGADIDKKDFESRISEISEAEIRTKAMTLAQQYHQEGRQEGRREGEIFSQQQSIVEALTVRFDEVPEGLKEVIAGITDSVRLQNLHRAAIRTADLESFSKEL